MKRFFLSIVLAALACTGAYAKTVSGVFNWSDPQSLTPAFNAPTSDNRYGEYISNVTFSDNGVTLVVNDDDVKEQSRRARFLYGYQTRVVEMRAYLDSDIVITAPEGMYVKRIKFEGGKASGDQLVPYDENSAFVGQEWSTENPQPSTKFYVAETINCTSITVVCTDVAGVESVVSDAAAGNEQWCTMSGVVLDSKPTQPGLYICRNGHKVSKVLIAK